MKQINEMAALEIDKFRVRPTNNLQKVRKEIKSSGRLSHDGDLYRLTLDSTDDCLRCQKAADALKDLFEKGAAANCKSYLE